MLLKKAVIMLLRRAVIMLVVIAAIMLVVIAVIMLVVIAVIMLVVIVAISLVVIAVIMLLLYSYGLQTEGCWLVGRIVGVDVESGVMVEYLVDTSLHHLPSTAYIVMAYILWPHRHSASPPALNSRPHPNKKNAFDL